jgi:signal transduction histidine kinase
VEQVFANLIGNALNYLDPGRPGLIEVGSQSTTPAEGPNGFQTYFVKDNGLGIPETYQPKIFQAFQRVHPEAARGEGMGLAIVRRIVERHGGKVWLHSRPGEGSTFYVTLPASLVNRL